MKIYDLAIIGAGLAGTMAAVIAVESGLEVLVLEKGNGPRDRKNLVCGWLGRALYTMSRIDVDQDNFINKEAFDLALDCCRKANGGRLEQHQVCENIGDLPLRSLGGSHYQVEPNCGRELSQQLYQRLTATNKADVLFGTEVERIEHKEQFIFHTNRGKLTAHRCILATGSYSVEWIKRICSSFNIVISNSPTRLGLRIEVPTRLLRSFLQLVGDLRLATEDVLLDDLRQNALVGDREDKGLLSVFTYTTLGKRSECTNFMASVDVGSFTDAIRIVKIINILSNDKVKRERAIDFVQGHSVLEHLEQFIPIRKALLDLDKMIPSFLECAIIHIPEIKFNGILSVDKDMKTAFTGLYGIGRCASGVITPLGSMASAIVAIKKIMEERNG